MEETSGVAARIKPIAKASIHRICSGEGILDLATAVKELIENSLDSGANNVDIRLKEYGADLIEVADNGPGVSPDNYQALTLRYYTSKISEFRDLQHISSFGFRGEALSSLCALSKVTITTRTSDEPVAARLEYDHSGLIVSQTCVARCVGTTVSVAKLFSPLPVRFKELRRNVRREYSRLVTVLQAYALIAKRVRLLCTNQAGKAGRTIVVQTHGSLSMRENIVKVFGTKTVGCLEWMEISVTEGCRLEGFISRPTAGTGRASRDRQFFFVNGRPVDVPKVAKLLNEVYRSFNSLQFPLVVINVILPTTAYDINVSPDKRKIFLHAEDDLIASLRVALQTAYAPRGETSTLEKLGRESVSEKLPPSANIPVRLNEFKTPTTHRPDVEGGGSSGGLDEDDQVDGDETLISVAPQVAEHGSEQNSFPGRVSVHFGNNVNAKSNDKYPQGRLSSTSQTPGPLRFSPADKQAPNAVQARLSGFVSRSKRSRDEPRELPPLKKCMFANRAEPEDNATKEGVDEISDVVSAENVQETIRPHNLRQDSLADHFWKFKKSSRSDENEGDMSSDLESGKKESGRLEIHLEDTVPKSLDSGSVSQIDVPSIPPDVHNNQRDTQLLKKLARTSIELGRDLLSKSYHPEAETEKWKSRVTGQQGAKGAVSVLRFNRLPAAEVDEAAVRPPKKTTVAFDMDNLRKKFERGLLQNKSNEDKETSKVKRSFMSATLDGTCMGKTRKEKEAALEAATKELEEMFNKSDFKRMKVLGQFNLRFILAKLDQDIFIVDQHAADEKYIYECLVRAAVVNSRQLLRPTPLELYAADEMIVAKHMETFRKNGFDFLETQEEPPGHRLQLTAVPVSKNTTFGIEDVQELISLLADKPAGPLEYGPGSRHQGCSSSSASVLPRPSRVREMFASQACKSSIMIGDVLSKKEMEEVLYRLAELEAPWTCPHGQPTIRHMVELGSTKKRSLHSNKRLKNTK